MANSRKRISELPALSVASLDTTFVLGISGSTTYKISINNLTSSLDGAFATDLVTNALSSSLNSKLSTSSFNSYTSSFTASVATGTISGSQQISDLGFVTGSYTTINSFNSLTQSFNSISQSFNVISGSVVSIQGGFDTGSYQTFTTSVNTSISNLNTFTASQSTSSLVDRLTAIESVSGSWITESETGSFLTSLSGAISSSAQITTFGFVSGSYETTGRGIISSSTNLVTTSSFNSYTASISTASLVTSISNLNSATSSYLTSLNGAISSSSQLTPSYDSRYSLSGSVLTSFSSSVDSRLDTLETSITRASGFVNTDVDVTLGNLKARISASGNKSLQLSTISGTYNIYGSGTYNQSGAIAGITLTSTLSITTTPTYIAAGYDFGVAGAVDVWNIVDVGSGIAWRITMIIGFSFLNNFISIERLH